MNIEMLRNYPKNTLNSTISNDLYTNYRFPDEIGPNNLEISFLQKKRNLERTMIHNKWKNSITPKKELDFFILKEQESFNEVFNKKNIDEFQGQIDNVINAHKTNSILDNKKINVEQMKSDSLHVNNYKNINYLKEMMNQNCNEIKVMKNNKVVYANNIDSFSKINKMGKKKNLFDIRKRKRGSKYRGVSKNGNQWQVLTFFFHINLVNKDEFIFKKHKRLIMFRKSRSYIGTYSSEELAARIYDISVIKKKGVKAITNFNYSPKQIKNIISNDIDIKDKNINLIILDLLKEK